jgi:thioredoxin reductase (NADPH)
MINRNILLAMVVCLSLLAGLALAYRRCWSDTCKTQSRVKHAINIKRVLDKENVVPILTIGSGPAGFAAALYTARGNIDTWVVEGPKPGGLLVDTTEVENWPSVISIMGPELMSNMKLQLTRLNVRFIDDVVQAVDFHTWPYRISLQDGSIIHAMSVIIATGAKPKLLGVTGESKYWGLGVTSCATCDAPFFKGEDVVVVGGGDSAVEEALQLAKHVNQVTILVRKERMRAAARMQDRLHGYKNISVKYNLEIQEIMGDNTKVTGVRLMNHETGQEETMATAGVFLAVGHDPSSLVFKGHIDMCPMGHIQMFDRTQGTSVAGVFAAGDVEDSRYRQAIVAAGHGVSAALDAIEFLNEIGFDETISAHVRKQPSMLDKRIRATSKVVNVASVEQFEALIAANKVVVADFFADYCPSCIQMLPIYDAVSAEFDDVVFAKIDANTGADIMEKYLVNKVPYLLVFKDEKLAARYRDTMGKKQLHDFVEQFVT